MADDLIPLLEEVVSGCRDEHFVYWGSRDFMAGWALNSSDGVLVANAKWDFVASGDIALLENAGSLRLTKRKFASTVHRSAERIWTAQCRANEKWRCGLGGMDVL
ncbi:hypothetical protein GCM10011591_27470 [Nocardia camponoti]|uniref:Uncharacterized protein n=1 Tax=Nocardia camponoti TaxID=1616106 RepID=A0A917QK45_9NOCA|nr:hypothetical protein GCM10011591_27470 [Nocardia camponoti]